MKNFVIFTIFFVGLGCSTVPENKEKSPFSDEIDAAIRTKKNSFLNCHEDVANVNHNIAGGNVLIKFDLSTSGLAENAETVKSDFKDERIEKCILEVIRTISFPQPKTKVTVQYPFSYR